MMNLLKHSNFTKDKNKDKYEAEDEIAKKNIKDKNIANIKNASTKESEQGFLLQNENGNRNEKGNGNENGSGNRNRNENLQERRCSRNTINKIPPCKNKYVYRKYKKKKRAKSLDPTDIYLREVNKTPLLTKEEEIHFATLAQQGDQKAFERMIKSNLRLVIRIARKYIRSRIPILDLIEEGNLGLIRAVEKFDPNKGFRFSTYATFWIQQNIERAIMTQNRTIKLPVHVAKRLYSFVKKSSEISKRLLRKATSKEIAKKLNHSRKEIEDLMILNEKIISLNAPISEKVNKPILDTIKCSHSNPLNDVLHENLQKTINSWLNQLSKHQRDVINRRFGLNKHEASTLEKTGMDIGLTRERVRQLQNNALKILKENLLKNGENPKNLLR